MYFVGTPSDPDMAVNGAALLRETGHVENRAALSFKMRRHSEQRADRNDTRSADARDEDAVGLIEARANRLGQPRRFVLSEIAGLTLLQGAAVYRDETRAEA